LWIADFVQPWASRSGSHGERLSRAVGFHTPGLALHVSQEPLTVATQGIDAFFSNRLSRSGRPSVKRK